MLDIIQRTYQAARPDLEAEKVLEVIVAAVDRARLKHNDWDHFAPAIEFLGTVFFTDHVKMPIDDYLETLYCAVKHGDFSKAWRAKLRTLKPAAADQPAAVTQ